MKSIRVLGVCLVILIISNCTESPFGSEDIVPGARQIRGKVTLSDNSNTNGVYVWLERFDLGARVDENGEFRITLPAPSRQSTPGGIDGTFDLYFYMANYRLARSTVATRDGEFIYSHGDISETGELKKPKFLSKFLRINTEVTPLSVASDYSGEINVQVTLEAVLDSVSVIFPKAVGEIIGAILLKKLDADEVVVIETIFDFDFAEEPKELVRIFPNESRRLHTNFNLMQRNLPNGKYEVIPYLLIRHEAIPVELLDSLGESLEALGRNYLSIPMLREDGRFEITD